MNYTSTDSDPDSDSDNTPQCIIDAVDSISDDLLPIKSGRIYKSAYQKFVSWKTENKVKLTTETAMFAYFKDLATTVAPPSLWSIWSMLKSTIMASEKIDIGSYTQLKDFIKKENKGYETKKAKSLKDTEIEKFLTEFPDDEYLLKKVVIVIGISGACRRDELHNITTLDVEDHNTFFKIDLPGTKTDKPRSFIVGIEYYRYVKKYIALRPKNATVPNFFIRYQKGRCINQVVGVNTIGSTPKAIATILGLENPELYTGHAFRRTSATLYVDADANGTEVDRLGQWETVEVAESYIDDSMTNKRKVWDEITNATMSSSSMKKPKNDFRVEVGASSSDGDQENNFGANIGPSTSRMKHNDNARVNIGGPNSTNSFTNENLLPPTRKITFSSPVSLHITNCPNMKLIFNGPTNFEPPQ